MKFSKPLVRITTEEEIEKLYFSASEAFMGFENYVSVIKIKALNKFCFPRWISDDFDPSNTYNFKFSISYAE